MSRIAVIAIVLLILAKLALSWGRPVTALGRTVHDDALFVELSTHLADGEWLGPYTERTLIKGPVYPMWLAAVSRTGLPAPFAQEALYTVACLIFVLAIRRRDIPSWWTVVFLVAMLLHPVNTFAEAWRTSREAIYPALTLGTLGCFAVLAGAGQRPRRTVWAAAAGGGLFLSAFWLCREEGSWLVPSLLLLAGAGVHNIWRAERDGRAGRLAALALPWLLAGLAAFAVAAQNRRAYGVFCTTEVKSREFVAAYGALARAGEPDGRRYIPVPEAARTRLYDVSPAFAELRPAFQSRGIAGGARLTAVTLPQLAGSGEVGAGFWLWIIRDAAAAAGHHASGGAAAAFYRRLADEVNAACDTGRIPAGPPWNSLSPRPTPALLAATLPTLGHALAMVATHANLGVPPVPSNGPPGVLGVFRRITRTRLADDADAHSIRAALMAVNARIYRGLAAAVVLAPVILLGWRLRKGPVRPSLAGWVVPAALAMALFARIALLSWIETAAFKALLPGYLGPAYLLWIATGMAIAIRLAGGPPRTQAPAVR